MKKLIDCMYNEIKNSKIESLKLKSEYDGWFSRIKLIATVKGFEGEATVDTFIGDDVSAKYIPTFDELLKWTGLTVENFKHEYTIWSEKVIKNTL